MLSVEEAEVMTLAVLDLGVAVINLGEADLPLVGGPDVDVPTLAVLGIGMVGLRPVDELGTFVIALAALDFVAVDMRLADEKGVVVAAALDFFAVDMRLADESATTILETSEDTTAATAPESAPAERPTVEGVTTERPTAEDMTASTASTEAST